MRLKKILPIVIALITLFAVHITYANNPSYRMTDIHGHLPNLYFDLTSDANQHVTQNDYHGSVILLFFGFTSCPDECPATMMRLTGILRQLGGDADHARVLFVTVDPSIDTPIVLHNYMQNFDAAHMTGLVGDEHQIRKLAQRYRAVYRPRREGGEIDEIVHAAAIYVFDQNGTASFLATPDEKDDDLLHDLRHLIKGAAP